MINIQATGTSYEVGFQCGEILKKNHMYLSHMLDMSEERCAYAMGCVPIYAAYYPGIIEEIRGISDALEVDNTIITAFVLGMYAYTVDNFCTCFVCHDKGQTYFARNSDFLKSIKDVSIHAQIKCEDRYRFIANSTSFIQMEDGMNEHGLAIGLTYVYPTVKGFGLNAGLLVRYLLETCKSVEEALEALQHVPIGSSQTLTLGDARGEMAVVECNCERMSIRRDRRHVEAVNVFFNEDMKNYTIQGSDPRIDLFSQLRKETITNVWQNRETYDITFVKAILSGTYGFLCQYENACPADTIWSSIYDVTNCEVYICAGNPSRETFYLDTTWKKN